VRAIEIAVRVLLLFLEFGELVARQLRAEDPREDVLVLQSVDRLQEVVAELEADGEAAREVPPGFEVVREVVDQRAVEIEDGALIQGGDTRP